MRLSWLLTSRNELTHRWHEQTYRSESESGLVGSQKVHRCQALHMIKSNSRRNNDFVLLNIERARIDSPKKCLISAKTRSNQSKYIINLGSGWGESRYIQVGSGLVMLGSARIGSGSRLQIEISEIRSLKKKSRSFSWEFFFQIMRKIKMFSLKVEKPLNDFHYIRFNLWLVVYDAKMFLLFIPK